MGAIQSTINQGLGTIAGASTVLGIGKAIGEKKADVEAEEAVAETESNVETIEKDVNLIGDLIQQPGAIKTQEDVKAARELMAEQHEKLETEKNKPYIKERIAENDLIAQGVDAEHAERAYKKAIRNVYLHQNKTNAIKLGYQAIIDKIVGKGE